MKVKNILINKNGDTVGATIINDNNIEINLKTSDILKAKKENNIQFENAVLDNKGFVRAKKGNLPKK